MHIRLVYGLAESRDGGGNGLGALAEEFRKKYPQALVIVHEWSDDIVADVNRYCYVPTLWVGHSYGGAGIIRAARKLQKVMQVHEMVLVDPVTRLLWGQFKFNEWNIPDNVMRATCLYQRNEVVPICSSIIRNVSTIKDDFSRVNIEMTKYGVGHCSICHHEQTYQVARDAAERVNSIQV